MKGGREMEREEVLVMLRGYGPAGRQAEWLCEELCAVRELNRRMGRLLNGEAPKAGKQLEEDLKRQLRLLREERAKVRRMVAALPCAGQAGVLRGRYLEEKSLEEAACALGMSAQWAGELHERGVRALMAEG